MHQVQQHIVRQQFCFNGDMQANNVRKEQSITQLGSRLTKTERDLKSSQTRFQEEKKLLTSREEELLKAKAEVRLRLDAALPCSAYTSCL